MTTYRLPNGEVTDDENLYHRQWNQLAQVVTDYLLPSAKLVAYDPQLQFDVKGEPLVLSAWVVLELAKNARTKTGKKFKLKAARASNCEMCKRTIHTMGAGRTRRFCNDCLVLRKKGVHLE